MKNLIISSDSDKNDTPQVHFNAETGILEITGESYMESPDKFYNPLIDWINEYINEINKPINLTLNLRYFNTSSSKFIFELLKVLKNYKDNNGQVQITWQYNIDDDDLADEINEFSKESGIFIRTETV
ncbi:MAG: DUF1987 domain-containing protein [Bacteroidales bacterium]|nr:DUF1987 domain-containing protein [Bacteroidales bacterium]